MGTKFWDPMETGNSGMMSQLPKLFNALNNLAGAFGTKFFGPLGEWVAKMGFIPKLTAWVERLTASVSAGPAGGGILEKLSQAGPGLAVVAGVLTGFLGMALQRLPLIGGAFKFLNVPLAVFIALIASSAELRGALGNLWESLKRGFENAGISGASVLPVLDRIAQVLGGALATAINWLAPHAEKLGPLFAGIGAGVLLLMPFISPLVTLFGKLAPILQKIWPLIAFIGKNLKFLLGPWGILIGLLIGGVAASDGAKGALGGLLTSIVNGIGPAFDFFVKNILPIVLDKLAMLGKIVGDIVIAIAPFIGQLLTQLLPVLFKLAMAILIPLLGLIGQLAPLFLQLVAAVVPLIPPIMEIVMALTNLIIAVLTPLIPIVFVVAQILTTVLGVAITILVGVVKFLIEVFVNMWNFISGPMTFIFNWLANIIKNSIAIVTKVFTELGNFWRTNVQPMIDTVAGWFRVIIAGAIAYLSERFKPLTDAFGGLVDWWNTHASGPMGEIAKAFDVIAEAMRPVLEGIGQFAANPLGGLMDWMGIAKDENGNAMSGGGVVGRAAGGAVLPGYSPGVDNIPYMLSPGESVLVPELTRQIGPENIMAANHAASHGRPAGDGPMRKATGGGGNITVADGAIRLTFQGNADYAEVKRAARDALNEVLERQKRSY
jgi:phage-related protein